MSGKRNNEVLEDKYASNAVRFGADQPATFKTASEVNTGGASANPDDEIKGFSSLSLKEDQELKQNKPDGLFKRKMKRIFGAVGDTKTKFL